MKNSSVYVSKHWLELATKTGIAYEPSRTGGKTFYKAQAEGRQGDYLIGCSLSGCIIWESPVGCLQLAVLNLEALTLALA